MAQCNLRITIGIPTFDRNAVLVETIARILEVIDPSLVEIIVADQTPLHDASTTARLEDWARDGRIRWLECQPPSLTAARNLILREAKAEIVLFLDDDVIVPDDLIKQHLECYHGDEPPAAVAGEAFHCHDPANPATLDAPSDRATPHFATRHRPGPIDEMVGAHHSIRRAVALALGGYDESFIGPANGEDFDMALRLTMAKHRIIYEPRAWVIHLRSPSGGCRIPGSTTHPEWTKSANFLLFGLRHWRNHWWARRTFWYSLRSGPFRKENLRNPGRWPMAWWQWGKAAGYAVKHRRFLPTTNLSPTAPVSQDSPH
jgi:GT2 family glycosyltransferase